MPDGAICPFGHEISILLKYIDNYDRLKLRRTRDTSQIVTQKIGRSQ